MLMATACPIFPVTAPGTTFQDMAGVGSLSASIQLGYLSPMARGALRRTSAIAGSALSAGVGCPITLATGCTLRKDGPGYPVSHLASHPSSHPANHPSS